MPLKPSQPVQYFLRDDDVGPLTDTLKAFVETFLARKLPVSYQIIPERLTQECADYLLAMKRAHPDLIEFGQHGLRHEMTLNGKRLKREFGPERTLSQQSDDIAQGLDILHQRLGSDAKIILFTPPQHKYDRSTLLAIAAAGHRLISAASYPTPQHRLAYALGRRLNLSSVRHHGISHHGTVRPEADLQEISISVAVDNGRYVVTESARLGRALKRAARYSDRVGMMFHHDVYDGVGGRQALSLIASELSRMPVSLFHTIEGLARIR